jgi:hypothetical protein
MKQLIQKFNKTTEETDSKLFNDVEEGQDADTTITW